MACLLRTCQKENDSIFKSSEDLIDPSNFNQVIDRVKKVSGFNNDDQTFEKSSTN